MQEEKIISDIKNHDIIAVTIAYSLIMKELFALLDKENIIPSSRLTKMIEKASEVLNESNDPNRQSAATHMLKFLDDVPWAD